MFNGTDRGSGRSRADVHLTNAQDKDDQVGEKEKNGTNTAAADWEP